MLKRNNIDLSKLSTKEQIDFIKKTLSNPNEDDCISVVSHHPWTIKRMKKPSKEVQLIVAKHPAIYEKVYNDEYESIPADIKDFILPYISDPEARNIIETKLKCMDIIE